MIIEKIRNYRDGGTIGVITDNGNFYVDYRIGTTTKGRIYDNYPDKGNLITLDNETRNKILYALDIFGSTNDKKFLTINALRQMIKPL